MSWISLSVGFLSVLTIQESVLLIESFSLDSYNSMGIKNWKMNYMNSNPHEIIKQVHIKKQEDSIWRNKRQKKGWGSVCILYCCFTTQSLIRTLLPPRASLGNEVQIVSWVLQWYKQPFEFGNKELMIWATVSFWSCFCWPYRASPCLAAKTIIWFWCWPSGDVHV